MRQLLLIGLLLLSVPAFAGGTSVDEDPPYEDRGDPGSWRARKLELGLAISSSASLSSDMQPQTGGFGLGVSADYHFKSWVSAGAFAQYRLGVSGPDDPALNQLSSWVYGVESTFQFHATKKYSLWAGPRLAMLTSANYGGLVGFVPINQATLTTFGAGGRVGMDYRFTKIFSLGVEVSYFQFMGGGISETSSTGVVSTGVVPSFGMAEVALLFGFRLEHL